MSGSQPEGQDQQRTVCFCSLLFFSEVSGSSGSFRLSLRLLSCQELNCSEKCFKNRCRDFFIHLLTLEMTPGSGMNLLDIRTRNWSEICLEATAPHLKQVLGSPLPSTSVLVRLVQTGLVTGDGQCLLLLHPTVSSQVFLCRCRVLSPPTLCVDMVFLRAAEWWPSLETTQVKYMNKLCHVIMATARRWQSNSCENQHLLLCKDSPSAHAGLSRQTGTGWTLLCTSWHFLMMNFDVSRWINEMFLRMFEHSLESEDPECIRTSQNKSCSSLKCAVTRL